MNDVLLTPRKWLPYQKLPLSLSVAAAGALSTEREGGDSVSLVCGSVSSVSISSTH